MYGGAHELKATLRCRICTRLTRIIAKLKAYGSSQNAGSGVSFFSNIFWFNFIFECLESFLHLWWKLVLKKIKWRYDPRSYERNFCNCVKKPETIQDFNGVWTRNLAIPVRRSNQLSYEATDVGSSSNVPVRNESTMKWYMKWIICELWIWNQVPQTNWAMKRLTLGAGHSWVLMFPWGMNQRWNDIWNGSYMNCGYEIKKHPEALSLFFEIFVGNIS